MTPQDIIRDTASRNEGITVEVNSSFGTVCISDDSGMQDDIFMQGDDAEQFISERDRLYEETGDMGKDVIELFLADAYAQSCWS